LSIPIPLGLNTEEVGQLWLLKDDFTSTVERVNFNQSNDEHNAIWAWLWRLQNDC